MKYLLDNSFFIKMCIKCIYKIIHMYHYLVEFLGTIFFVYVILASGNPLVIGATLSLLIILCKNISGGHFNPAVTITMAAMEQLPSKEIIPYVVAQVFGGLVALQFYKRMKT